MNKWKEIDKLYINLNKAHDLLGYYLNELGKHPNDFSIQLSIKTAENHVTQLRNQLNLIERGDVYMN